jgi:phage shock protein A
LFERLRDAFRAALDAATPPSDLRQLAREMREAVVEAKVAVVEIQEAVARTERELAGERQRLADAERRGRLAAEIQDQETVSVAERFATKHRERAGLLQRKLATQREELALAERDLTEMRTQLKAAERDRPAVEGDRSTERAWRDIQGAGGARPGMDLQDELLKSEMDRAAREAAAVRQLEELKKKMRKD